MTVGEKIKKIREAKGLSQAAFASPLGVEGPYISQIENDKKEPSKTLVSLLLSYYRVNEQWWETDEGDIFQQERREKPPTANEHHPQWTGNERVDAATQFLIQWVKEETRGKTPAEIADMIADMREVFRRKKSPGE